MKVWIIRNKDGLVFALNTKPIKDKKTGKWKFDGLTGYDAFFIPDFALPEDCDPKLEDIQPIEMNLTLSKE